MNCRRSPCVGLIWDFGDEQGPHCSLCGRSPLPPPTRAELLAAGILGPHSPKQESEGRRGGKGMKEYSPSHLSLKRPLTPWQRS